MTAESTKHRRLVRFNDGLLVSFQAPGVRASYGHKHATFTEQGQKTKNTSSCLLSNSAADQAGPSHTGTVECTRLKQAYEEARVAPPIQSLPIHAESKCLPFKPRHTQPSAFKGLLPNTSGRNSQRTAMPNTVYQGSSLSLPRLPLPPKPSGRHYNFCCSQEEARRGGM